MQQARYLFNVGLPSRTILDRTYSAQRFFIFSYFFFFFLFWVVR